MLKKILACLLALMLLTVCFCACGGDGDEVGEPAESVAGSDAGSDDVDESEPEADESQPEADESEPEADESEPEADDSDPAESLPEGDFDLDDEESDDLVNDDNWTGNY